HRPHQRTRNPSGDSMRRSIGFLAIGLVISSSIVALGTASASAVPEGISGVCQLSYSVTPAPSLSGSGTCTIPTHGGGWAANLVTDTWTPRTAFTCTSGVAQGHGTFSTFNGMIWSGPITLVNTGGVYALFMDNGVQFGGGGL